MVKQSEDCLLAGVDEKQKQARLLSLHSLSRVYVQWHVWAQSHTTSVLYVSLDLRRITCCNDITLDLSGIQQTATHSPQKSSAPAVPNFNRCSHGSLPLVLIASTIAALMVLFPLSRFPAKFQAVRQAAAEIVRQRKPKLIASNCCSPFSFVPGTLQTPAKKWPCRSEERLQRLLNHQCLLWKRVILLLPRTATPNPKKLLLQVQDIACSNPVIHCLL